MSCPRIILLTSVFGFAVALPLSAAVTMPTWYGEPNTTSQVFLFNSSNQNPAPNTSVNLYGMASAAVEIGDFGNGWEDPGAQFSNPGYDGDGAWDVGPKLDMSPEGKISFALPVAPGGLVIGQTYNIDIMVYAVAYQDLQQIPTLSILGVAPGDISLLNQGTLSTRPPAGSWQYRTWTATMQGVTGSVVSMALTPPAGEVSVIDRVEIFSRYTVVPEPSSAVLVALSVLSLACHRRRAAGCC